MEILTFPDKGLRERAKEVTEVTDDVTVIAHEMSRIMYEEPGIGLAAPQIGKPLRLIVVDTEWGRKGAIRNPLYLLNPEIVYQEGAQTVLEGCLSVPGIEALVKRSLTVRVQGLTLEGKSFEEEASGIRAACFQHELDHLDGILFIDRISRLKKDIYLRKYKKLRKKEGWDAQARDFT